MERIRGKSLGKKKIISEEELESALHAWQFIQDISGFFPLIFEEDY